VDRSFSGLSSAHLVGDAVESSPQSGSVEVSVQREAEGLGIGVRKRCEKIKEDGP
jgi:hypothetical protein